MTDQHSTEARARVLDAAEQLFSEHGYKSVTLRDIAKAVGIKHASLYHHAPDGKEALFVEVTERGLRRHQAGLEAAIQQAEPRIEAQLEAAAHWLLAQPVLDFGRMMSSDMPAIGEVHARRLSEIAYASVMQPIQQIFRQAAARGEIKCANAGLLAGGLLALVESIHHLPAHIATQPKTGMVDAWIDVIVNGLRPNPTTAY
ncbi:MAG: TetR/AcrR family transcriptional regulator [Anaerolineae bacterium]|nr:TetR/AcrR family transcriptional regulator [Anaerolineae bacterium]